MSQQIFGFFNNDDSLTSVALTMARAELGEDASQERWGGLGIGWIQDGRVLERKNPRVTGGVLEPLGLLSDLRSREIIGYATEAIGSSSAELPPHRFRKWLYVEEGATEELDASAAELISGLPDFLQRNVPGSAATAARFFYLLDELFHQDAFHAASHRRAPAAAAVASGLAKLAQSTEGALERGHASMLATERLLVAATFDRPLYYRVWNGLQVPADKPLFAGHRTRPVEHSHYRAVLVMSHDSCPGEQWQTLEPGNMLWLDDGWEIKTRAIIG